MDEYLPMFLAECREHLEELGTAVMALEAGPEDPGTLDELFRGAHSLKGMCAAMGYEEMAHLTHQMEDVLELLRERDALPPAVADVLLACLDALAGAVDAVEATGAEALATGPLVDRLQALVRAEDAAGPFGAAAPAAPAVHPVALAEGERVLHLEAELARDAVMPSVRALQLLQAAGELGAVVRSDPDEAALDGWSGSHVVVELATGAEAELVEAALAGVDDVAAVSVVEPEAPAAPAPAPAAPEPEAAREAEAAAPAAPAAPPVAAAPPPAERRAASSPTVRVDAGRLDDLMHQMGELVVARTQVEALAADAAVPGLARALQELTRASQGLQAMVMQIRMIPVEAVLTRFPRLVRDVAGRLGKSVHLEVTGKETELDRTVVDALGDPLVHLVRNSLDHGLEGPEERRAAGKPETGTLTLAARHAGGSIVIDVADDGRGVDPARVGAKAVERGLITPAEAAGLDAAGAVELLFSSGFSTADAVGDLSGRGVGLDAVRDKIRGLGGEVSMTSVPGQGTRTEIRLPLTLAILAALLVEADGRPYGLPLGRVERTLRVADGVVRRVAGRDVLVLDGDAIPICSAREAFGHEDAVAPEEATHLVLLGAGDRRLALAVSRLVGQVELVTRPLPPQVGDRACVSGAAVLASGDIVLLADCDALADHARRPAAVRPTSPAPTTETPRSDAA